MSMNESQAIKVAVVTDDGKRISAHFGRARHYMVATIQAGELIDLELRPKTGHQDFVDTENGEAGHEHTHGHGHEHGHEHGRGAGAQSRHTRMFAAIPDCRVVVARGMGAGAYEGLLAAGIRPIVTTIVTIEEALQAYLTGQLEDHPEKLH